MSTAYRSITETPCSAASAVRPQQRLLGCLEFKAQQAALQGEVMQSLLLIAAEPVSGGNVLFDPLGRAFGLGLRASF